MHRAPRSLLACFVALACLGTGGCAARGLDALRIEAAGADRGLVRSDRLRVATLNMWGVTVLGLDWSDDIDARFDVLTERLGENAEGLDVLFVQEAWKDSARRRLVDDERVVRRFPYRVDAVTSPGGSGLVVLSGLPIEEARFQRFGAQGCCAKFWEGDCISGKGILAVRVAIGARSYWLGNTHLIACYEEPETECDEQDANGRVREEQTRELLRFMQALPGPEPALVAGDFNFTRTSRYFRLMLEAGWSEPGEAPIDADRVDYIFTRAGERHRWRPIERTETFWVEKVPVGAGRREDLSDHTALAADFCLAKTGDPQVACLSLGEIRN